MTAAKAQLISPFWKGVIGSSIPIFLLGVAFQSGRISERVDGIDSRVTSLEAWRNSSPAPRKAETLYTPKRLATLTKSHYELLPSITNTELFIP